MWHADAPWQCLGQIRTSVSLIKVHGDMSKSVQCDFKWGLSSRLHLSTRSMQGMWILCVRVSSSAVAWPVMKCCCANDTSPLLSGSQCRPVVHQHWSCHSARWCMSLLKVLSNEMVVDRLGDDVFRIRSCRVPRETCLWCVVVILLWRCHLTFPPFSW